MLFYTCMACSDHNELLYYHHKKAAYDLFSHRNLTSLLYLEVNRGYSNHEPFPFCHKLIGIIYLGR